MWIDYQLSEWWVIYLYLLSKGFDSGFYPKDLDAVVNQGQKIVCNEEKDTWTTVGGEPIKTAIECIQGCKEINLKVGME